MKPVWIDGNKVDWQRSEITIAASISSIEPKILAVLQVLVEAKGDVVSQQVILDAVWENVIVAPNALQRCIAQLRKLFSDDAKTQRVIKTHPKKGYSLVAEISLSAPVLDNSSIQKTPISTFKQSATQLKLFLPIILGIILLASFYLITSLNNSEKEYKTIEPITSSDSIESMPSLSNDKQLLAYINIQAKDEFADSSQLIIKNLVTHKKTTLLTDTRFKGGVYFSPDNQYISYSQVIFANKTKCAQIMRISLVTRQVEKVIPCNNNFYHSPYWLDKNTLLTLKTDKRGGSELIVFDITSNKKTPLNHDLIKPHALAYNMQSQTIATIAQSNNGKPFLFFVKLNQELTKITIVNSYSLPFNNLNNLQPKWFDDKNLLIAKGHEIYWFDASGLIKTTQVLTPDTLFSAQAFNSHGDILAVLGEQDMDVRLRTWDQLNANAFTDKVIERSTKKEFSGKFQPYTNNIGFISSRTGHNQIWLKDQKSLKQLTHIKNEQISSFTWSKDGNKLAFLTDNTLWVKTLNNPEKPLNLNFKVKDIYQWWQDETSNNLLLNASIFDKAANKEVSQIISLNLATLVFTTEFKGENYWAQKISSNTLIMNDHQGHIFKVVNNQKQIIKDLDHITVQWRYYWRENILYIQDKKQNIWQYDVIKDQANIIQKFDLKSLFMTDFNPLKMQMLSDNYAQQQKDLVLFKVSN